MSNTIHQFLEQRHIIREVIKFTPVSKDRSSINFDKILDHLYEHNDPKCINCFKVKMLDTLKELIEGSTDILRSYMMNELELDGGG